MSSTITTSQRQSLTRAIVRRFGASVSGFTVTAPTPLTRRITDDETGSWVEGNFAGSRMVVVAEFDASAVVAAQPVQQAQADASTFITLADAVAPVVARLSMVMPVQQAQAQDRRPTSIVCDAPARVIARVDAFAAENGRTWRAKLRNLWMDGSDTGALREARNHIGPSGLDAFKPGRMVSADPAPAMVPQPCQQPQAQDTRAASPILQRLAEAQAELDACDPIAHPNRWDRAFYKRDELRGLAYKADPVAYVRAYPSHAYAYRHLLPADMVARIEAAETDEAMREAVRETA